MGDHQRLTELDGDDAAELADEARRTEYFDRLESYLGDEHDESVPTDEPRAFERGDGVRAVSFESETGPATRPDVAVTIHFDEGSVVQATAERRGADVDGAVELVFPAEIAPGPETAVRDILRPEGQSVEVTVRESDAVTTYTIEP